MAEASQEETTLDRRSRIDLVNRIFQLIEDNSLDEIKQIFGNLHPEQCIQILNSSINGIIPLFKAIRVNNVEMSRYFLKMSLLQGQRKMNERWKTCRHPFMAAIIVSNLVLMQLILQHLDDINDIIVGPFTSLIIVIIVGMLMPVKLIVAMGADINQQCSRGKSPLIYSVPDGEICRYLLSKGANISHQDENGFTALYCAVDMNCKEGVEHLVRAGADDRIRTPDGLTPLIVAIINLDIWMFEHLLHVYVYSELDLIEAFEILNACKICSQRPFLIEWERSLKLRKEYLLPKICQIPARELLDFSKEFTTQVELDNLQDRPLQLGFQSILVIERILGRNNRLYIKVLLQTALIAITEDNMEKVRQLIDHIQEYCQETYFVDDNLSDFDNLFSSIAKYGDQKIFEGGGFAIFKIIAQAIVRRWNIWKHRIYIHPFFEDSSYNLMVDTFLEMTSKIITLLSEQYLSQFREVIKRVVKEDPGISYHASILHHAVKLTKTSSWCSVDLIEILLESGADPNSKDYFRRTPIMYAVKHVPGFILNDVLALLTKYGGHPDCRNNEGFTALDNPPLESCLNIKPLSLQCLATEVILDKKIPYRGILPKIIENFVNLHE